MKNNKNRLFNENMGNSSNTLKLMDLLTYI